MHIDKVRSVIAKYEAQFPAAKHPDNTDCLYVILRKLSCQYPKEVNCLNPDQLLELLVKSQVQQQHAEVVISQYLRSQIV